MGNVRASGGRLSLSVSRPSTQRFTIVLDFVCAADHNNQRRTNDAQIHAGTPPAGDGVFNQLDIVAAQQAAIYLAGSYAGVNGETLPVAVPEPASFALLGIGFLALAALSWPRGRRTKSREPVQASR